MRCASGSPALHVEHLVDAVDVFCERIGFTIEQTRRVFEQGALARAAREAPRRAAFRHGRCGAGRANTSALSCDHLEYASERRAFARWQKRAPSRCCCRVRITSCARRKLPPVQALRDAGVPIAIATDHNPGTSPTLVAAVDAQHGVHVVPPDAGGSGARHDGERCARARPARPRRARARQARGLRRVGRRASERARLLVRPQSVPPGRRGRQRASRSDDVERRVSSRLHRGVDAAARQRSACRHAHSRRRSRPLRRPRARRRGQRLASRPRLRVRARDGRGIDRADVQPLPDRPESASGRRADVCGREQHRAVPDALFHRRAAVPRRPRTGCRRDRAARASATGGRITTRSLASSTDSRSAHGHAIVFDGHSIKSELPWLFEGRLPDLNLGTANGASCAPSLRAALAGVLAAQACVHARRRRPLQGRLHHAPLRAAGASASTRCSSRCASRATWTSSRRSRTTTRASQRLQPGAAKLVRDDDRVAAARWRIALRRCGRRSRGSTGAWRERVLFSIDGRGRWASIVAGVNDAPAGATVLAGPALPGLVNAHSHAFQRAFAGLAEHRGTSDDDFWSWRERMYAVANRIGPDRAARDRDAALRRDAARRLHAGLRVPLPAARAGRQPLRRSARHVARAVRRRERDGHRPDDPAGALRARRVRRGRFARRAAAFRHVGRRRDRDPRRRSRASAAAR